MQHPIKFCPATDASTQLLQFIIMQKTQYIIFMGIFALFFCCVSGAPSNQDRRAAHNSPTKSNAQAHYKAKVPYCKTVDTLTGKYNGIIDERYRWEKFYVQLDAENTDEEKQEIENALKKYHEILPCVEFAKYEADVTPPSDDFIKIVRGTDNGCSSYIGKIGGQQHMNLQVECAGDLDSILHEMGHALGLDHEHNRFDRDDFVTIHPNNILPEYVFAFDKVDSTEYSDFGVEYNIHSIMHYDGYAFTSNGQATITSKNGEPVGSQGVLQDTDIRKLQAMYKCN